MPLTAGARLGSYEILAPLGAGGMGAVYRARDPKLRREVAIKVLPDDTADDPGALVRFQREARAVAALSHPNILSIHDFGISDGVTYAVAELLQGETLRQKLAHGPIPVRRAIEIAREIALGLSAAHEKGIVHRDLKPDNIFLTRDGRVKILDFGLARKLRPPAHSMREDTLSDRTEPGKVVGTTGYMSPEQIRGGPVDARSDIFSFGAMLYEMLSGRRAFRGDTSVETLNAILREDPPPLAETGRAIPPVLERVAAHCLEKQPEARFQSARDLAFDLGSLSISTASDTARIVPVQNPWPRRALLAGAAAAALALAFRAGDTWSRSRHRPPSPVFRRLTFRRGTVQSARFAPDGKTVVYGAAWDGGRPELYSVRTDSIESRSLGLELADVLSVSSRGDLAVLLRRHGPLAGGMLARVPLGGGAARELMESVSTASWAPEGDDLAILRELEDGKRRLEFPIGRPLYDGFSLRAPIAVSPDGRFVAVAELQGDRSRTRLLAIGRTGEKRILAAGLGGRPAGLAWSADSSEVYFVGGATSERQALRAVDLSGRERIVLPAVGSGLRLHDVAPDGRMLVERSSRRLGLICRAFGEPRDREISWLDGSDIRGISNDGLSVVFREAGDGGGNTEGGVYLRRCDGSPAVKLGDGEPFGVSPDGRWALALGPDPEREIVLLPTGAGSPKRISAPGLRPSWAAFVPDGSHIAVGHESEKGEALVSLIGLDGGAPRRLPIPRMGSHGLAFSPDASSLACVGVNGKPMIVSLASGETRELPGPPIGLDEVLRGWSADGRYLYFAWTMGLPATVSRRDIATGVTSPWLELQPSDAAGVTAISSVAFTPDGRTWAYSYNRTEASDLFVVEGLR